MCVSFFILCINCIVSTACTVCIVCIVCIICTACVVYIICTVCTFCMVCVVGTLCAVWNVLLACEAADLKPESSTRTDLHVWMKVPPTPGTLNPLPWSPPAVQNSMTWLHWDTA